jgi:hypothetical protein
MQAIGYPAPASWNLDASARRPALVGAPRAWRQVRRSRVSTYRVGRGL